MAALSCEKNVGLLRQQIADFRPEAVCVACERDASELAGEFPKVEVFCGDEGLKAIASMEGCDMVINSLMGIAKGLEPTMAAIERQIGIVKYIRMGRRSSTRLIHGQQGAIIQIGLPKQQRISCLPYCPLAYR